jgi:ribosomal protein L11 methyltransferase
MPWAEVSLSIPRDLAEDAERILEEHGALAITYEDSADDPVLEPMPGTAPLWPGIAMRGLFTADVIRGEVSKSLLNLPGVDRAEYLSWREVADQDWTRAWMDRFRPMKFGQGLWIIPTGMEEPEDPEAVLLRLDPGLAFGTGTHPTTALCLEWIDAFEFSGCDVVDYGCGSGVLGIAAALKGANHVICVDNDPQALEATEDNARRNKVVDRIRCESPESYRQTQADVVLANILAGPLIELAPVLLGSLASGGQVVLSGILEEQADDVAKVYRAGCESIGMSTLDGWVRLHGACR